jgi:hypothetical protein
MLSHMAATEASRAMSIAATLNLSRRSLLIAVGVCLLALTLLLARPHAASAAACSQPATDYGNVTGLSMTAPATTTYRIWTRMAAADTTNNTYLLEIDGTSCYTVGGSTVPTYANGATTYFNNNTTNWISKTSAGTQIDVSLSAGAHTFKLIGNAPNVVVDRLIMTQDTTCVPTGTGDNCANPPDTTPPVVSITSPANNATVSTVTSVSATATDDVAVSKVEFYVDGVLKSTDSTGPSPFTYSFDPSGFSIGAHTLTAKAYDAANNSTTSSVVNITTTDTVAPTVSITSPTAGATVSGTFVSTATAADNVGVSKVEFYVDGALKTTDTTGPSPYSGSVDVSGATNGTHSLTAKAYDAAGNITTSTAVSITVSNTGGADTTAPTATVTSPTASAVLSNDLNNVHFNSSAFTANATAADASGIKQVAFKVDGVAVGTPDTAAPYTYTLNLTSLSCGTHTITAVATDNSTNQNVGNSTALSFTSTFAEDIAGTPDCHVTFLDLSALASKYNQSSNVGRADINQDGTVNFLDLSALASKYGQ